MPRLPPKWPPIFETHVDDRVADLLRELRELLAVEFAEVVRRVDGVEERHGRCGALRIAVRR